MPGYSRIGLIALAGVSLHLAAVAGPALAQAQSPAPVSQAEIVLADFSFTPVDLKLKAGEPVTLTFVNKGSGGHNFVAPQFFAAATMDAATRAKLGKKGTVELAKGKTMAVTLTPKAGGYKVRCTHFLHSGFGMKGTIKVN